MSEYAVTGSDSGQGSLLAALAEGAFMIGLELNRSALLLDLVNDPDSIMFTLCRISCS